MKYKIIVRKNPQDKSAPPKFYPAPVYSGTESTTEIAEKISHSTSLTSADSKAVYEETASRFAQELSRGMKMKIDGIGSFRITFGGTGSENADEVTAQNISGIRIAFVADPRLRQKILSSISFEKMKQEKAKQEVAE